MNRRHVALMMVLVLVAANDVRAQSRVTGITEAVKKVHRGVLSLTVETRDRNGRVTPSYGTAFIVDERGFAVTSGHVVKGAFRIKAYLPDGTMLKAHVLAEETQHDVAILQLEADVKQFAVRLGSSGDLMLGETVVAIGNTAGLSHTVSRGIVSGLDRNLQVPGQPRVAGKGLIQTDAPINAGNSGGPLVNINGEVIGMAIAMRTDVQGVAFAVPVDTIKDALCKHLSAQARGGLRHELVCTEHADPEDALRVRLASVAPASPAAQAGFRSGDEIVRIAGRKINNRFDVERALWERKEGDKIMVSVRRGDKTLEISYATASQQAKSDH